MIIPIPVILLFGALALPLRKDQPMEVYLAAMLSFYLKPRRRLWLPDGIESLVEITAPKVEENQRTKDLSQAEAQKRLSYLADIVDTEGWAVRRVGAAASATSTSMIGDVYYDAQATVDPLDDDGTVAQSFESMIAEADEKRRHDIMERMLKTEQPSSAAVPSPAVSNSSTPPANPYSELTAPAVQTSTTPPNGQDDVSNITNVHFNPYPSIHQSVIQPLDPSRQTTPITPTPEPTQTSESTSENTVSPDIIKLVNNSDLSIETIAREAQRIHKKDEGEEVVISLR